MDEVPVVNFLSSLVYNYRVQSKILHLDMVPAFSGDRPITNARCSVTIRLELHDMNMNLSGVRSTPYIFTRKLQSTNLFTLCV